MEMGVTIVKRVLILNLLLAGSLVEAGWLDSISNLVSQACDKIAAKASIDSGTVSGAAIVAAGVAAVAAYCYHRSAMAASKQVLEREREAARVRENSLRTGVVEVGNQLRGYQSRLNGINEELQKKNSELEKHKLLIEKLQQDLLSTESGANVANTKAADLQGLLTQKEAELQQIQSELLPLRESLVAVQRREEGLKRTIEDLRYALDQKSIDCDLANANLVQTIKNKDKEMVDLRGQVENLLLKEARFTDDMTELDGEILSIHTNLKEMTEGLERIKRELEEKQRRLEILDPERRAAQLSVANMCSHVSILAEDPRRIELQVSATGVCNIAAEIKSDSATQTDHITLAHEKFGFSIESQVAAAVAVAKSGTASIKVIEEAAFAGAGEDLDTAFIEDSNRIESVNLTSDQKDKIRVIGSIPFDLDAARIFKASRPGELVFDAVEIITCGSQVYLLKQEQKNKLAKPEIKSLETIDIKCVFLDSDFKIVCVDDQNLICFGADKNVCIFLESAGLIKFDKASNVQVELSKEDSNSLNFIVDEKIYTAIRVDESEPYVIR